MSVWNVATRCLLKSPLDSYESEWETQCQKRFWMAIKQQRQLIQKSDFNTKLLKFEDKVKLFRNLTMLHMLKNPMIKTLCECHKILQVSQGLTIK